MEIYSCEISDLKVSVFSFGLDNFIKKTEFELVKDPDFSDSDVLVFFSRSEDKAVSAVLDKIYDEGTTASLRAAVYMSAPGKVHPLLDAAVSANESELGCALSDFLKLLDCYAYINTVDIGERLYGIGNVKYKPLGGAGSLSECELKAKDALSGIKSAVFLLEVPEDVWISDIDGFAAALEEGTGNADICLAAQRRGGTVKASAFIISD